MSAQPLRSAFGHGLPAPAGFDVNSHLTPNSPTGRGRVRRRRSVENDEYTAFCVRILRAAGRRIGQGDVEALPELVALQDELDQALAVAVTGLRGFGYSWAEIASRLGITRQAAQQRWGGDRS